MLRLQKQVLRAATSAQPLAATAVTPQEHTQDLKMKMHQHHRIFWGKGVSQHIYENPYGTARDLWIKSHFKHEATLFDILANVKNFGVGRKVQFRMDIDPYSPINTVNAEHTVWSMQEMEIANEYAESERTKESDEFFINNAEMEDQINSTFWTITRVVPDYTAPNLDYGTAYGALTLNGYAIPGEREIRHGNKPGWLLVPKIYEKDLIVRDLKSEATEASEKYKNIQPEVTIKPRYSKLPPLVAAQSKAFQVNYNNQNKKNDKISQIPMMRNVVRRGGLENLTQITLLEDKTTGKLL